jgi:hypothetical protein
MPSSASTCWSISADDEDELKRYAGLLRERRGTLCLFVPARPELYAPIDKDFGHFRRYTRAELRGKLISAGFEIARLHYFNCVGYFAWWLSFCLWKKRRLGGGQVRFYDRVIFPVVHAVESRIIRPPSGRTCWPWRRRERVEIVAEPPGRRENEHEPQAD